MAAAVDEWFQADVRMPSPHVQGADPLGSINLVGAEADQIGPAGFHIEGHFAGRLGGVAMKEYAFFLANRADLGNGMQGADFIIGGHDADENSLIRDGVDKLLGAYLPEGINRQVGDDKAVLLQSFT